MFKHQTAATAVSTEPSSPNKSYYYNSCCLSLAGTSSGSIGEIITPRSLNSSHMNGERLSRPLAARTIFSNGQAWNCKDITSMRSAPFNSIVTVSSLCLCM
ncbi:hypothetical protein TNCV_2276721 [Trichonephila clavipes]|nr:hypothetical protein TNCV_2276721 [Trichonephila clavipes]